MSDDTEKFYELHDEITREASMFASAAERPLPDTASDAAGAIALTMSPDGEFAVTVGERWRETYGPAELGAAIVGVFQELGATRNAAWAANVGEEADENHRSTPIPRLDDTIAAKLQSALEGSEDSAAEVTTVRRNALSFLDDVTANFDEVFEDATRRERTVEGYTLYSRDVTVELTTGGDLSAISFSQQWLQRASGAQITREVNDAVTQCRAQLGDQISRAPFAGTPLEADGTFIDDQEAFINVPSRKELTVDPQIENVPPTKELTADPQIENVPPTKELTADPQIENVPPTKELTVDPQIENVPPTKELTVDPQIKVCFEALSKDARIWDAAGDVLATQQGAVEAIDVYRGAFSFAALDLADLYSDLHTRVSALLNDGATETRAGAVALRDVRADFERFEDVTRSELYQMWQPVV